MSDNFDPIAALKQLDSSVPLPTPIQPSPVFDVSSRDGYLAYLIYEGESPGEAAILVSEKFGAKTMPGLNPKDALGMAKPDLSVIPPAAELHLASAMMDGARKYGAFNWRENAVLCRVYVAAARRHLLQFLDGENVDPTSGVHHLGHAMACCAILLDAQETGNLSDDRPLPGAAGDMIRRWNSETKFKG